MSITKFCTEPSSISWQITDDLDKQKQLFYNQVETDYTVHAFVCSCGRTETVICKRDEELAYCCSHCGNQVFLDANMAWHNFHAFSLENPDPDLIYTYRILKKDNGLGIGYALLLPKSIDFLRNKVLFEYKDICQLILSL